MECGRLIISITDATGGSDRFVTSQAVIENDGGTIECLPDAIFCRSIRSGAIRLSHAGRERIVHLRNAFARLSPGALDIICDQWMEITPADPSG